MSYEIPCANCYQPTGAWLIAGDPCLPLIYCTPCAETEETKHD